MEAKERCILIAIEEYKKCDGSYVGVSMSEEFNGNTLACDIFWEKSRWLTYKLFDSNNSLIEESDIIHF